ncbi:MAG TPA: hypothetical protein PLP19_04125 [bacterium]|nr:hypothetical protein [bacterium]HPN42656.1 hypothetical protein [bacterium]
MIVFLLITFLLFVAGEIFLFLYPGIDYITGAGYAIALGMGYFISLFNIISGYLLLRWAFNKEAKIFYSALYGGMALRFVIFIVVLFLIYKYFTTVPLLGFVGAFVFFYCLMQIYEIKIINQELKSKLK